MKKTVSGSYNLSYLVSNPKTKVIVLKHLEPLNLREEQLKEVHGTLRGMFEQNMGGGIPYDIINALMNELNKIQMPLESSDDKITGA